jgi:hypothetical protein
MTELKDLRNGDDPGGRRPRIAHGLTGRGVIQRITDTGAIRDDNPVVELVLTIELPGREPYLATHRQVVSRFVVHNLGPGTPVPVRVDAADPERLEIG